MRYSMFVEKETLAIYHPSVSYIAALTWILLYPDFFAKIEVSSVCIVIWESWVKI